MNTLRRAAWAAAASFVLVAMPAKAQNYPLAAGNYVDVTGIGIDDGHALEYATWLAGFWRAQEDFAQKNGWTTGYEILSNVNPRHGEPDLYLIRRFRALPDAVESAKRDQMMRDQLKMTDAQMESASGDRAKYRHIMSSMLLQEMRFK